MNPATPAIPTAPHFWRDFSATYAAEFRPIRRFGSTVDPVVSPSCFKDPETLGARPLARPFRTGHRRSFLRRRLAATLLSTASLPSPPQSASRSHSSPTPDGSYRSPSPAHDPERFEYHSRHPASRSRTPCSERSPGLIHWPFDSSSMWKRSRTLPRIASLLCSLTLLRVNHAWVSRSYASVAPLRVKLRDTTPTARYRHAVGRRSSPLTALPSLDLDLVSDLSGMLSSSSSPSPSSALSLDATEASCTEERTDASSPGNDPPESQILQNKLDDNVQTVLNGLLLAVCFGYAAFTILNIDHGMTRGWTQSEIAMRIPLDNWNNYETALAEKPIYTKTLINVVIYLLGDWLSQTLFQGKNALEFDAMRTLRNGLIGLGFGPLVHEYYQFSDHILPVEGGIVNRLEKILMDQTIYLTVKCSIYIMAVGLLNGEDFQVAVNNVKTRIKGIVFTAWKFWPLVHCVTYGLIPARHRILWVNCVDLVWNAILATMSRSNPAPVTEPPSEQTLVEPMAATSTLLPSNSTEATMDPFQLTQELLPVVSLDSARELFEDVQVDLVGRSDGRNATAVSLAS